jgi:hypothetical protein
MHYGETKKVRAIQGDQFIKDFKRVQTIVIYATTTSRSFPALKTDVWGRAKTGKIYYKMTTEIFANNRLVMLIA